MRGGEAHHRLARGVLLLDRQAGIAVLVLVVARQQHPRLPGARRCHRQPVLGPAPPFAVDDDREAVVAPHRRRVTRGRLRQLDRRRVERRRLHHHLVVEGDLGARVAAVERLRPDQRRRRVRPPCRLARALHHRVEVDGQVVGERPVDQRPHRPAVDGRDGDLGREEPRGQQVGIGPLQPLGQDVAAVGRDAEVGDQARRADRRRGTVEPDPDELAGEIMVEQRLVVRVAEQILVGPRRRGAARALLHDGAGRRRRRRGRRAAPGGDGVDDQRPAIGHPREGRPERAVQAARHHARGAVALGDPQRQAVGSLRVEGQAGAVGRPVGRGEARALGQLDLDRAAARQRLEGERVQPLDADLGLAVGRRIDAIAAQPQDRLRQVGDRGQILAAEDRERRVVGAGRDRGGRRRLQRPGDRVRRAVVSRGRRLRRGGGGEQQGDQAGTGAHGHILVPLCRPTCHAAAARASRPLTVAAHRR